MDEIEAQIMSIFESADSGLEVSQVVKEMESRYHTQYNAKRIRHKMDTLCDFKYLVKETYRFDGMQGPDRYLYRMHHSMKEEA